MKFMFSNCKKLEEIIGINKFSTNKVKDMSAMFQECGEIKKLDLSNFNTSSVTNMKNMFYKCDKIKYLNLLNFMINSETQGMLSFQRNADLVFKTNNKDLFNLYNSTP